VASPHITQTTTKLSPYVNTGTTFDHGWESSFSSFLFSPCRVWTKGYWFKLLYELALNSGCDYLRRVRFIIGRIQSPPLRGTTPFHHGVFTL